MNGGWTEEELEAAVESYVEMQRNERAGRLFITKQYYRKLMQKFGRTEKAYELRMQNISYVLSLMGRGWLPGLKPARNIDSGVAARIEKLLEQIEGQRRVPIVAFEIAAREQARQRNLRRPQGNPSPKSRRMAVTHFQRDASVKAWVLQQAGGVCECCEKPALFSGADGLPYLELHYVWQLAEGGPDVVSNAVALCPGCHSEIHHGANAPALVAWLYDNVARLRRD
ncbi:HNH endonuclease [Nitrosovibrio tenuis]|uniref:5-methylcytosine-specific restriction enzyme A n=1 Tax=Nitrosovibrio tenuis TaxID=1233 RepID=A0A1H7NP35_9PROT|nr:HNH endonuclease signature motif containing protein [Nitrosovibrio tenuis]SEL24737.1 5-methylcytosine-specific restriction enzyme A [Nitrosovibrio tenuis]